MCARILLTLKELLANKYFQIGTHTIIIIVDIITIVAAPAVVVNICCIVIIIARRAKPPKNDLFNQIPNKCMISYFYPLFICFILFRSLCCQEYNIRCISIDLSAIIVCCFAVIQLDSLAIIVI